MRASNRFAAVLLGITIAALSQVSAQIPSVTVKSDFTGGGSRIILTHSEKVTYAVHENEGRIEVLYGQEVLIDPSRAQYPDSTLKRHETKGGQRLVFYTTKDYRAFQTYELNNPFRLVLDIQGARPAMLSTAEPVARRDPSKTVIVLDPGHGGLEDGAIGPTGLKEKDIALDLARRLKQTLQLDPSISVVLTRDEDRLVGLDERTAIANHNQADLFVSIHLNASPRGNAKGAETYYLSSDATDDEARTLAALENRAAGIETDAIQGNGTASKSLDLVLWDLAQNRFMAQSSALAESMQRRMNEFAGTKNRGVRQAPFRVLMGATMPAILVEVGFISNRAEEEKLNSLGHRNQLVNAMAAALKEFLRDLQRVSRPAQTVGDGAGAP